MSNHSAGPSRGLLRSASILSIGNMASRMLGLVREMVINAYFGADGQVSAFRVAAQVPTLLYDFLIGGMLSAALVPVLSEQAQHSNRSSFAHLVGVLITLFSTILLLLTIGLELAAPFLAPLLAGGFDQFNPGLLPLTVTLIRIVAPAVCFFGLAGVLTAVLYALNRFSFPAMATAIYNLGIILAAPLLSQTFGIISLAVGILVGSLAQLCVMLWDLQRAATGWKISFEWRHPALRKILMLYLPNTAALVVALFQVGLDRRLASSTDERSIAWMATATTLQQMPLGLISIAISLAALPKLSQYFAAKDEIAYQTTLTRGLRLVTILIVPLAIILWVLSVPITQLIFERGKFESSDTVQVAQSLHIYLIGMVFAAIDFPLNYAFYARNTTWVPSLVGVLSVVVYIIVAYALLSPLGYLGLVWADTAKQAAHAGFMIFALGWFIGWPSLRFGKFALIIVLAGALMSITMRVVYTTLTPALPVGFLGLFLGIGVVSLSGLCVYGLCLYVSKVEETILLTQQLKPLLFGSRIKRGI